jgi:hypothetical protein
MSDTLPPGVLPNVFDTDPPNLDPTTIVGDGFVKVDEANPQGPPQNVDVPHAIQDGMMLICTLGNWNYTPTSYVHQWQIDGHDVGGDVEQYGVTADQAGHNAQCLVTASNAYGDTQVPSDTVTIVDNTPAGMAVRSQAKVADEPSHDEERNHRRERSHRRDE